MLLVDFCVLSLVVLCDGSGSESGNDDLKVGRFWVRQSEMERKKMRCPLCQSWTPPNK